MYLKARPSSPPWYPSCDVGNPLVSPSPSVRGSWGCLVHAVLLSFVIDFESLVGGVRYDLADSALGEG